MGWFKKKEEELLPDLPNTNMELPRLPPIDPNFNKLPNLDNMSLPNISDDYNEMEIKDAIYHPNQINNPPENMHMGMQRSKFEPIQMHTEEITVSRKTPDLYMNEPRVLESNRKIESRNNNEPIYIRLDKFKEGLESFDEIKQKIIEIEELLKKIKHIKEQEDKDLEEWEREIHIIKSRIESIDNNVFNQLD